MQTMEGIFFMGTGTSSGVPLTTCLCKQPPTCSTCTKGARGLQLLSYAHVGASGSTCFQWMKEERPWKVDERVNGWHSILLLARRGAGAAVDIHGEDTIEEDLKNLRNNTCLLIRHADEDGILRNVLIDCGKTFRAASLSWFPVLGIQQIDAVIITHDHLDATGGLDDLREWTRKLRDPMPIYISEQHFLTTKQMFPHLCDSSKITGGGGVSTLDWHTFPVEAGAQFNVFPNFPVTVLPVQHGKTASREPYLCMGFRFWHKEERGGVVYVSDASKIPDATREHMMHSDVLVLDCLWFDDSHPSHFGGREAVETAMSVKAKKTYLTGFSHRVDHARDSERCRKGDGIIPAMGDRVALAFDGLWVGKDV